MASIPIYQFTLQIFCLIAISGCEVSWHFIRNFIPEVHPISETVSDVVNVIFTQISVPVRFGHIVKMTLYQPVAYLAFATIAAGF